jgi:hypothetical protein
MRELDYAIGLSDLASTALADPNGSDDGLGSPS